LLQSLSQPNHVSSKARNIAESINEACLSRELNPHFEKNLEPGSFTTLQFVACVNSQIGASRIAGSLASLAESEKANLTALPISILVNENLRGVKMANVIVLGCKPYDAAQIFAEPALREALRGKILISLLGGLTVETLERLVSSQSSPELESGGLSSENVRGGEGLAKKHCLVVRAMPSIAAQVQGSMTILSPITCPEAAAMVRELFSLVGGIKVLPSSLFDPAAALCASGPAIIAFFMQALVDGSIYLGIQEDDALELAARTIKGTVELMTVGGMSSEVLTTAVATKGGATEKGLEVLRAAGTAETVSQALRLISGAMWQLQITI